jgi:aminocarboxymuconate-semialdehyde decarboxylase
LKIDIHSHLMPRAYLQAVHLKKNPYDARMERDPVSGREVIILPPAKRNLVLDQLASPEAKIEELDRFGLDMAIVSPPLYAFHHELVGEAAAVHARLINDGMAEIQSDYGQRLRCMAMLPLQVPDLAISEIDRAVDELGLKAAAICANIDGRNLDEPAFRPVFAHLAKRGVFLFVHALLTKGTERLERYRLFNAIGNPLDDSIAVFSLIYGGILEAFPGLKICIAHGGGQAPYIVGRVDRGYRIHEEVRRLIPKPPSEYLRLLYFDTILHDQRALRYLIQVVGSSRVMLGSDCPYHLIDMGDPDPLGTVNALLVSEEEKGLISGGNAALALGI